jgi:tetratricopeptide (TPR) repeat protein
MDADDLRRAVTLRLQAYVLDELEEPLAAAEAYERAAEVRDYPARAPVLIAAGEAFERAGEDRRAIDAYQRALSVAPGQPNRAGLLRRIAILEYRLGVTAVGSDKEHSVK